MNNDEMRRRIYEDIELPAFGRITDLIAAGLIQTPDAAVIRTSADNYKSVLLEQYLGYDAEVRNVLIDSLFADYRNELNRLIDRVAQRHRVVHSLAGAGQALAGGEPFPIKTPPTPPTFYHAPGRAGGPPTHATPLNHNSPDRQHPPLEAVETDRPSQLMRVGRWFSRRLQAKRQDPGKRDLSAEQCPAAEKKGV